MEKTPDQKQFGQKYSKLIKELSLQRFESSDNHFQNEYLVPKQNFERLETKLKTLFPKVYYRCSNEEGSRVYTYDSKKRFCDLCSETEGVKSIYASDYHLTQLDSHEAMFYAIENDFFKITGITSIKQEEQEKILTEHLIKFKQTLEKKCREVLSLSNSTHWEKNVINQKKDSIHTETIQLDNLLNPLLFGGEYTFKICSEHKKKLQEWELPFLAIDNFKDEFKKHSIELKDQDINVRFEEEKIFRLNIDYSKDTDNSIFKNLKEKILKLSHLVNPNFAE